MNNLQGKTVYGVKVLVMAESWTQSTSFNFLGKKFEQQEYAEAFLKKVNVNKIYPSAHNPRIVERAVRVISDYLTPDCQVTEITV